MGGAPKEVPLGAPHAPARHFFSELLTLSISVMDTGRSVSVIHVERYQRCNRTYSRTALPEAIDSITASNEAMVFTISAVVIG